MQDAKRRNGIGKRYRKTPDPRIGTVTFNPGPDAEERLWRFFDLVVGLATGDQVRPIRGDTSMDGRGEEEV